jgi:hypothetical protein
VVEPERATTNGTPEAKQPEPEAEAIDLLSVAGPSVFKRAAPVLAAVLAVLAIVVLRRRSR